MGAKPDRNNLPIWIHSRVMSELHQALHRQGIDTMYTPYAGQALRTLEARVQAHVDAMMQDFAEALRELEARREEAGLPKVFK